MIYGISFSRPRARDAYGTERQREMPGPGFSPHGARPDSSECELPRLPTSQTLSRYTVEHSLHGEADQLKEYRLGLEVFGRCSSYEPQKDPIVRLEASRLRAKLREYYEDEGRQDPVVISVPKGGYAATFVANGHREPSGLTPAPQVTPPIDPVPSSSKNAKIGMAAVICIVVLLLVGWALSRRPGRMSGAASRQSISMAVLPLQNLSGDPTQDFLADGITENLIDNLSRLPGLRVMARSTAFRYKGAESDPQKAGRDLHVRAVLSGKLLEHGGPLVVQMQLVDVAKGSLLWDNQYRRKLAEIQSVQEDISRDIPRQLQLYLTDEEMALSSNRKLKAPRLFSCISGGATTGTNEPRKDSPKRSNTLTRRWTKIPSMHWPTRGGPTAISCWPSTQSSQAKRRSQRRSKRPRKLWS